jgi:hypothetical protein
VIFPIFERRGDAKEKRRCEREEEMRKRRGMRKGSVGNK